MLGYKSITELSLEECCLFLQQKTNDERQDWVNARYVELSQQTARQEEEHFCRCKTVDDFDDFIKRYAQISPYYHAKYLQKAQNEKNRLLEEARKREQQRQEEARRRAQQQKEWEHQNALARQRRRKRGIIICVASLVIVAAVIFLIGRLVVFSRRTSFFMRQSKIIPAMVLPSICRQRRSARRRETPRWATTSSTVMSLIALFSMNA